ncbi:MAG: Zn-dependent exopeptidase M28 [Desulfobacteraceae bacterium]|nr:Zn-dependent exopeptidase M28 [Desulfobacteraceae bacterium]
MQRFRGTCPAKRIVLFFLLSLVLFQLHGSPPAQASGQTFLARVELDGMVNHLTVPVYAHLQGKNGVDYALVIAARHELEDSGAAYMVLHDTALKTQDADYLIALERLDGARDKARQVIQVLYDDGRNIITCATRQQSAALNALGFEIEWLSQAPLVFKAAGLSGRAVRSKIVYNSLVEQMIDKVQRSTVYTYCANLTGDNSVNIGGTSYEIYTRNTYNSTWMTRSTQYAYEFFENLELPVQYHYWSGSKRNVIAVQTGTDTSDEIILITAHLDNMPLFGRAPGADDNASGSTGVMLAADILSQYRFERTIRYVLFTGEEQGLFGSRAYANMVEDENIIAVFNLDMIGWDAIGDPVVRLHTRTPKNPGYAGDKQIADIFIDVVDAYGMEKNLIPVIDADGITASDHASFWNKGFSAILAIEDDVDDFCDYYHTSKDTLDTLNMDYFTNYIRASIGTIAHLSYPVTASRQIWESFTYPDARKISAFKIIQ